MSPWPPWSRLRATEARVSELTIAVLFGGRSSERDVSLVSGQAVLKALPDPQGPQPRRVYSVEILTDGRWSVDGQPVWPHALAGHLPPETVFLIALHGGEGEGGSVQGFLETCGWAHTGESVAASALALDKVRARIAVAAHGVRIAPGVGVSPAQWRAQPTQVRSEIEALGPGPWFAKPSLGGSSVSMCRATTWTALADHFDTQTELLPGEVWLVEQSIPGLEATQGLFAHEDPSHAPHALPLVEIQPQAQGWFDFQQKYGDDGARETCPPEHLDAATQARVRQAAQRAWRALGLQVYARLDFMVPESGDPVFLEANTLPGFTPRSLFPLAAREAGWSYRDLCFELCLRAQASSGASPSTGSGPSHA